QLGPAASGIRLVDSISNDMSGSGMTSSMSLRCSSSGGGGGGGGAGRGGRGGSGAVGRRGAAGLALEVGGASRSRNTRLDVLCFPDFVMSSSGGLLGLAGAGALIRPCDGRGSPYIRRCSSSNTRRC